jgi:predicted Zn-dependent peptidase
MVIPDSKKLLLNNGLKIMTEEIPAMRSVAIGILVGTGSGNEIPKESGISHLMEHMAFKGTAKRSAYEIAHALDAVGGKMNAYTGKEYTMYYAVVLDKHIDTAIDVLCDIFLNSLFDPKDIALEKGVVLEEIKMYEDTPGEAIHDLFAEKILCGHPIGRPTLGLEETVNSIMREDILNYQKKWYSPHNTIVALAGAIPQDVENKFKRCLESWQGKEIVPSLSLPEIKGSLHLKKKQTEQVHLCLGVKGVSQVDEDRYPYAVLDNILGGSMSSRLFQEIREKRGLAYSIYSAATPFRDFGISYVYAGTSQENLKQVIDLVLNEFTRLKKEKVNPKILESAKEYLKGTLVLGMESTTSRMSWLAKSEFYYDRVMTIDEIFDKVDKVTQDDIINLAGRFFRDEYLTLAVIGDMQELPIKEIHC